jgi:hypothetical protein
MVWAQMLVSLLAYRSVEFGVMLMWQPKELYIVD